MKRILHVVSFCQSFSIGGNYYIYKTYVKF